MKQLNLNALTVFLTLYHSGSTQKAALKLARSQSYVSKVLAHLREDLDDPLFIRTSSGLEPTSYAKVIAPKIKEAMEMMRFAIEPESFNPLDIDKITIHLAAPFIVPVGKQLIKTIRSHTPAVIELREWTPHSEALLIEEQVDLGVHALQERPQSIYQRKIMSVSGQYIGNRKGEFVKTIVDNYNENKSIYQQMDTNIKPGIVIDNYYLLGQLMDEHYSYSFANDDNKTNTPTDVAIICKTARRNSPKVQWLMNICTPVIKQTTW